MRLLAAGLGGLISAFHGSLPFAYGKTRYYTSYNDVLSTSQGRAGGVAKRISDTFRLWITPGQNSKISPFRDPSFKGGIHPSDRGIR